MRRTCQQEASQGKFTTIPLTKKFNLIFDETICVATGIGIKVEDQERCTKH